MAPEAVAFPPSVRHNLTVADTGGLCLRLHGQAARRADTPNELHDRLMIGERTPRQFSVMWQNSRCSILFHFDVPGGKCDTLIVKPVRSAKRCNSTFQRRRALLLPPASAVMSSSRASGYVCFPHVAPPAGNRFDGEGRRVVIDADADPARVLREVVDAVGNGFAERRVDEIMHAHLHRIAAGLPFAPAIRKRADQLFLLRIHRDHGGATAVKQVHPIVDERELLIAVGMIRPFDRLLRRLQAVAPLAASNCPTFCGLTA